MELSLVLTALRRKRWLIVLFALVGLVPGILLMASGAGAYTSRASLSISPPDSELNRWSNQPDRYVLGQIGVLQSGQVADAAAKKVGDGETAGDILSVAKVSQQAQTDLVDISVTTSSAQRSQAIAQALAEAYLDQARTSQAEALAPEIAKLDERLTMLGTQVAQFNQTLATATDPYLRQFQAGTINAVPDPLTIDPATTTARNQAVSEYDRLLAIKNDLQFGNTQELNSVVVSKAGLGEQDSLTRDGLIIVGGGIVGALLGVAAALLLAQLAGDTLDDATVSRVLGVAVAAHVVPDRSLRPGPLAALESLPPDLSTTVDKLCARADSMALSDEPLTVAVVGSQPRAGTTTLALAMARRFADFGFSVLIIDGDARRPYLTDLLAGPSDLGLSDLATQGFDVPSDDLTPTFDPRISVLGQGAVSDRPRLQRQSVSPVLEFGRRTAQVVIVDAGSALGSSFAIQTCRAADAVVLAVPLDRQRTSSLREVSRQLESELPKLIPVLTSPGRRAAGRSETVATTSREVTADPQLLDDSDDSAFDDPIDGDTSTSTVKAATARASDDDAVDDEIDDVADDDRADDDTADDDADGEDSDRDDSDDADAPGGVAEKVAARSGGGVAKRPVAKSSGGRNTPPRPRPSSAGRRNPRATPKR